MLEKLMRKSWEVCGCKKMSEIEVDVEGSVSDVLMFDNDEIIEIIEAAGVECNLYCIQKMMWGIQNKNQIRRGNRMGWRVGN